MSLCSLCGYDALIGSKAAIVFDAAEETILTFEGESIQRAHIGKAPFKRQPKSSSLSFVQLVIRNVRPSLFIFYIYVYLYMCSEGSQYEIKSYENQYRSLNLILN